MLYRSLRAAARIALRWYYADVVVQGIERAPAAGPLLVVANHPNALIDALLAVTSIRRRVRLTAKATLFEHPLLAPLLRAVGVVPLRRAADERAAARRDGVPITRNDDAFRQVRETLAAGSVVLVFPEGISHDQPALAPLRSGAARMALDACARGVRGLQVLPLGLVFERKERPGSRVLVRVGEPLVMDRWLGSDEPADGPQAATRLTRELDERLREVTLNFANDQRAERAIALAGALADIVEPPPMLDRPRSLVLEAELAHRIERATSALERAPVAMQEQADAFVARVRGVTWSLAERGASLGDVRISRARRSGAWFVVREGVLALVALPLALLGRLAHWVPIRLARALAMRPLASDPSRDQPAMRTIVLGLGLILLWYLLQAVVVTWVWGGLAAAAWIALLFVAAQIDLRFRARTRRALQRARTYLALRADPAFGERALAEVEALVRDAESLERALIATRDA